MSNITRANRAKKLIAQYDEIKGEDFDEYGTEIVDIITDMLHLAKRQKLDTEVVLRTALYHFEAESLSKKR